MSNFRVRMQERRVRQAELPFWQRGLYLPLAVLVVAALIVGGVFLAISGGDEDPAASSSDPTGPAEGPVATATPEPEDDTTTSGPVAAPTEPAGTGDCDTPSSRSGDNALTIAPDVEWSPVGNASTAASPSDGPAINEPPRRCYSKTAAGALLAVNNFAAEAAGGEASTEELLGARVVPGSPAYSMLEAAAADGSTAAADGSVATTGYRFVEASDDAYEVALVVQVPSGSGAASLVEMRASVQWVGEDWMVTELVPYEPIGELPPGYVVWGPSVGAEE